MATNPMMPQRPMGEEAGEPANMQEPAEAGGGSYYIEIEVKPDGTFVVGMESESYEEAEEAGAQAAGESKPAGQQCANVTEALKAVVALIQQKGGANEEADLAAGFKQVRGGAAMGGANV